MRGCGRTRATGKIVCFQIPVDIWEISKTLVIDIYCGEERHQVVKGIGTLAPILRSGYSMQTLLGANGIVFETDDRQPVHITAILGISSTRYTAITTQMWPDSETRTR